MFQGIVNGKGVIPFEHLKHLCNNDRIAVVMEDRPLTLPMGAYPERSSYLTLSGSPFDKEDIVLVRSTECEDIRGRTIYENDIVYHNGRPHEIIFKFGCFQLEGADSKPLFKALSTLDGVYVIGNTKLKDRVYRT